MQLMPVAKACKLEASQKPKQARDPRRQNRRLHLCERCANYKQQAEFYLCCLYDESRTCRSCMLRRPSEPFGEHLIEEQRTEPVLRLADALLTLLGDRLVEHERLMHAKSKGATGVAAGMAAGKAAGATTAAATTAAATTAAATTAAATPTAATATAATATAAQLPAMWLLLTRLLNALVPITRRLARHGLALLVAVPLFLYHASGTLSSAALSAKSLLLGAKSLLVGAMLLPGVSLLFGAGSGAVACWLLIAVLLPVGAAKLQIRFPKWSPFGHGELERLAGFSEIDLELPIEAIIRERLAETTQALGRRARKAKRTAAAATAAAIGALEDESGCLQIGGRLTLAEETAARELSPVRQPDDGASREQGGSPGSSRGEEEPWMVRFCGPECAACGAHGAATRGAAAAAAVCAACDTRDSGWTRLCAGLSTNVPLAAGICGAVLLPSITLLGLGGTAVLALWLLAAVLCPLIIAQLHATFPCLVPMLVGDVDSWVGFQNRELFQNIELPAVAHEIKDRMVETTHEIGQEISRRARKAKRTAARTAAAATAAAIKELEIEERNEEVVEQQVTPQDGGRSAEGNAGGARPLTQTHARVEEAENLKASTSSSDCDQARRDAAAAAAAAANAATMQAMQEQIHELVTTVQGLQRHVEMLESRLTAATSSNPPRMAPHVDQHQQPPRKAAIVAPTLPLTGGGASCGGRRESASVMVPPRRISSPVPMRDATGAQGAQGVQGVQKEVPRTPVQTRQMTNVAAVKATPRSSSPGVAAHSAATLATRLEVHADHGGLQDTTCSCSDTCVDQSSHPSLHVESSSCSDTVTFDQPPSHSSCQAPEVLSCVSVS